ncbi:hypothetical protein [Nocardia brasiliensis]|uniref:hypothetical protein n=1 Tax=Nocardia brasiliensis TaxID=37326 RepID=UPI002455D52A|nr:hypothetical protein [Nocardia brasiliensis]
MAAETGRTRTDIEAALVDGHDYPPMLHSDHQHARNLRACAILAVHGSDPTGAMPIEQYRHRGETAARGWAHRLEPADTGARQRLYTSALAWARQLTIEVVQ